MSNKRAVTRRGFIYKKLLALFLIAVLAVLGSPISPSTPTNAEYTPGIPPAVDPGTAVFSGMANPVPAEPVGYNPSTSMLEAIFDADVAAGGSSYWFDRVLARPFMSADYHNFLFTRGRALYMYTYSPGTLGFAGGYAYRERPSGNDQNLYTLSVSGGGLSENTSQRVQYPSHASQLFTRSGLSVLQRKFITYNNVAVVVLTLTNTGGSSTNVTVTASSPIATSPSGGTELTGTVNLRYGLSTIFPRLSGDGFTTSGSSLTRTVSLSGGQSTTLKLQLGALANEIPASATDYQRYRGYNAQTAFQTHLREYNEWWVDNVPYIDIPDQNIKKMSYYRTFLNRYNYIDADIPGNDFQFPVSIEGVTGYNNAIQLTQPMHLQDLKYFRNPVYAYGNWISSGETSAGGPFTDNPGGYSWTGVGFGTYEQYISHEAFESYKIHGGDPALLNNLAHYAEGDLTGYLGKYDQNNNYMISYQHGADTGNDADAVALAYYQREQERTESAFWYAGALAAAEAYTLLGNTGKANSMNTIANNIQNAVLNNLWDNSAASSGGKVFKQKDIQTGNLVPWKDQQNWAPFSFDLVPNTADYRQALRFYADANQMPLMPSFTANQADKAAAVAAGKGGSNNFSNINSTLHAQLLANALRNYSSQHVTPEMYRKLIEWQTWTEYINGDNRLPDNNEFWNSYNAGTGQIGFRSWIHHNILGAYNFMLIEDVMGVHPRADNIVELWPIDMGYDYFTLNNLNYHGKDFTLVWDRPGGTDYYANAPEGYSLYLDGQRVLTVDDLTHLTWNSSSGNVTILGAPANVTFSTSASLQSAINVSLSGNARMVDIVQKAGVDISDETGDAPNLAAGKSVSASFTASNTNAANAVDGFTISGTSFSSGSWNIQNPIWGAEGSSSSQHWFQINLGGQTTFDTVKLYFYSDKTFEVDGNDYRQPSSYTVQYFNGSSWVDAPGQIKTPNTPLPNYNKVTFSPVSAQQVRIMMTRTGSFGIGLKEVQVFNTGQGGGPTPTPTVTPTPPPAGSNVALGATPSTSYVSPWETLAAINDDFTPANSQDHSNGAYGNWPETGVQQVQYNFSQSFTIDRVAVYWWDDNQGIDLPSASSVQYWNGSQFVNVTNAVGNGTAPNQFNVTTFNPVTTTAIRLLITSNGSLSTGVLEFQVFTAGGGGPTPTPTSTPTPTPTSTPTPTPTPPAGGTNVALGATPSTSYVSPWETLAAINDGFTPANSQDHSHGAYGNWPQTGVQQVQYNFSQSFTIDRVAVYWWDDNQGIDLPSASSVQYWNGSQFVNVTNAVGNGTAPNQFNVTTFNPVTTTAIRLLITSNGSLSTGILEFQVFTAGGGGPTPTPTPTSTPTSTPTPTPTPTPPAGGTNLALGATPSTSHVSPWETLAAINDGFTPANSQDDSNGAYGNWPETGVEWVQYDFDQEYTIDRVAVYWWDDNQGIDLPSASSVQYLSGSQFVNVSNAVGNGTAPNQFNVTTFNPVTTTAIRLLITSNGSFSTGVLEFQVFGAGSSLTSPATSTPESTPTPTPTSTPTSTPTPSPGDSISQANWTLHAVDSEELSGQDGAATNAFDGDSGTIWHTEWESSEPAHPHEIQIDLGATHDVTGFRYLPRQDSTLNGAIAQYEFYVSADGSDWGSAVATGAFAGDNTEKEVTFAAKTGRYIRLVALSEVNDNPWTSVAEINVLE